MIKIIWQLSDSRLLNLLRKFFFLVLLTNIWSISCSDIMVTEDVEHMRQLLILEDELDEPWLSDSYHEITRLNPIPVEDIIGVQFAVEREGYRRGMKTDGSPHRVEQLVLKYRSYEALVGDYRTLTEDNKIIPRIIEGVGQNDISVDKDIDQFLIYCGKGREKAKSLANALPAPEVECNITLAEGRYLTNIFVGLDHQQVTMDDVQDIIDLVTKKLLAVKG